MRTNVMLTLTALLIGVCPAFGNPLPVPAVWGVDPTMAGYELVYMDAFSPTVFARYPLPGIRVTDTRIGLAGDAGWVLYYVNGDTDPNTIHLLSSGDGSHLGEVKIGGVAQPHGLGLVAGMFFAADEFSKDLLAYPLGGGPSIGPWSDVYDVRAVAGDTGNRLFVYSDIKIGGSPQGMYAIYELDPLNPGAPARFFSGIPGGDIVGMASDYQFLYVSDSQRHLFVIDASSGGLVHVQDLGFVVYGLGTTRITSPESGSTAALLLLALVAMAVNLYARPGWRV